MTPNNLKLLGASLYLCEGTKARKYDSGRKYYAIEMTNTDPRIIRIFMSFLREIIDCVENRVKAEMFIYPDLNEERVIAYWSNITRIPKSRFNKSIVLNGKTKFKTSPFGTIKIRYTHKEHFLRLQGIIDKVFGGVG
ncbi:MAG TPA: hypothetical protein PLI45_03455 [Candidatus Woesebacteria bacterium]|nr:hypothetical protein [Candidatus Woesebacteria bacterium]